MKKVAYIVSTLIMGWILYVMVVVDKKKQYPYQNPLLISNLVIFLVVLIFFAIFLFVFRFCKLSKAVSFNKRKMGIKLACCNIFVLLAQLFIVKNILFLTDWDAGALASAVDSISIGEDTIYNHYYQMFPNNVPILALLLVIRQVANHIGLPAYFTQVAVGTLGVNLSLFLLALCIHKLTHDARVTWGGYWFAVVFYGLNPWMSIAYTDSYAILFPILVVFLYLYIGKRQNLPLSFRQFVIIITALLGCLIKPTCIIVLMAIGFYELFSLHGWKDFLIKLCWLFCAVSLALLLILGAEGLCHKMVGIPSDNNVRFTWAHFLMMGHNIDTWGVYNYEDVLLTQSLEGSSDKSQVELEIALSRMKELGGHGLNELYTRKALINYNDATFGWSREGNGFYITVFDEPFGGVSTFLREMFYYGHSHYLIWASFEQFLWMGILLLVFFSAVKGCFSQQGNIEFVAIVSIVGITLFTLLFEARARYLYLYAPVYVLAAVLAVNGVKRKMSGKSV